MMEQGFLLTLQHLTNSINYFHILDRVLVGLTERFEPDETSRHLSRVEYFLLGKGKEVNYIAEHYRDDVNGPRLLLHRDMLVDKASADLEVLDDFRSIVIILEKNASLRGINGEVSKLVRIVLTLPVSSCTAERSFSGLRRSKNPSTIQNDARTFKCSYSDEYAQSYFGTFGHW